MNIDYTKYLELMNNIHYLVNKICNNYSIQRYLKKSQSTKKWFVNFVNHPRDYRKLHELWKKRNSNRNNESHSQKVNNGSKKETMSLTNFRYKDLGVKSLTSY